MIRSELIHIITLRNPHLYHHDVEKIVSSVLDDIGEALANGDRVELRGFGIFSIRHRPSRSGRNPSNGTAVFIEEKWTPFFRASKEMQERLNPKK
ncbi:integration host factor subunit beta [Agrobacterium genomosp. 3]|uniref:integration host factor subunit beta n=1 Tax=Agrobacterium tomkonis TaxID=1183410 RepID=UPI001CD86D0C|nr:integration host factor subunit beta [Agrobacterium tomkonis]MCA1878716.1 integration host factor subunit beta [Agrobacterium tumefaciens]MCA1893941.1 integration host factor subunit beta [Agrobacterium tomkonis]